MSNPGKNRRPARVIQNSNKTRLIPPRRPTVLPNLDEIVVAGAGDPLDGGRRGIPLGINQRAGGHNWAPTDRIATLTVGARKTTRLEPTFT